MKKRPYVERIDRWLDATGAPETRLGLMACANQFAVERIRSGTASVATLEAVLDYIKRNPASKE